MIVKELTYLTNGDEQAQATHALERLLSRIQSREELLENYDRIQADSNRILIAISETADLLDNTIRTIGNVDDSLFHYLPDTLRTLHDRIAVMQNRIHRTASDRTDWTNELDELRARVTPARMRVARARTPEEITLRADDLRKRIGAATGAKNLRLQTGNHWTEARIEAVFDNIILTPTDVTLPFWAKCINSTTPSVRIPPVKVAVHIASRHVKLKRIRGVKGYISGMGNYAVAHPHVTSHDGSPCLGDWGAPIMEAIEASDWELTFDLIKQFLRSAAHNDAAGKYWLRYLRTTETPWRLTTHIVDAWRYYSNEAPMVRSDTGTGFAYLLFTGNGNYEWFVHDKPDQWPEITIQNVQQPTTTIIAEFPDDQEISECNDVDYNEDGYDEHGYDRDGYDRDGYDRGGYDGDGYDRDGYDRDDYDRDGYDEDGYDRDGYNREGYDREGYNSDGIHYSEAA